MLTSAWAEAATDITAGLADYPFSSIDFSAGALVAVSGGSDSTALLLLLKDHLDRNAPNVPLLAATVDHALRPDSAAEAQMVARLCARYGIPHRTLRWHGDKPATGLPAAAREARYRLLAEAAKDAGIALIVTAHTADDQAETVLMRQARGAARRADGNERGLAGMAPATLYDWQTWIVRPLLELRRQALRDFLRDRGVNWVEDPTNLNEDFERPRVRIALRTRQGPDPVAGLLTRAAHAAAARQALSRRAALLLRTFASAPTAGLVRLDPGFAAGDREAAVTALRILLATIGGTPFPPNEVRTAALIDRLGTGRLCATLSRTVIDARRTGIFLYREHRGLPAAATVRDRMIWDGRRRINLRNDTGDLVIEPAGTGGEADPPLAGNAAPASLVAAARAAEPRFRPSDGRPAIAPGNPPQAEAAPIVSPFAHFLPSFDLELAAAVADLIGAPALPASPLHRP